jgi:hypothetical protein
MNEVSTIANPFGNAPIVAQPTGASAVALAQREMAEIQSMVIMARKFPRDQRVSVDRILTACARESLAEEALYEYSRGGTSITGPSIRLAEEISRQWGNILSGVNEVTRQNGQSEVITYAWDLETNTRDEKRFIVRHWRDTRSGGHSLTDDRDIYEHVANMAARRKRACILAVIPIDVQDAAVKQCEMTLHTKIELTEERKKAMLEAFGERGITKAQLEKRIQRSWDSVTPGLFVSLRKIYASLKDGMSAPGDWFEALPDANGNGSATATSTAEAVKNKLKSRKGAAEKSEEPSKVQSEKNATAEEKPKAQEMSDYIPMFDKDSAIAAIRAAFTDAALRATWKDIAEDFGKSKRQIPLDVEATYHDRLEALRQAAQKS